MVVCNSCLELLDSGTTRVDGRDILCEQLQCLCISTRLLFPSSKSILHLNVYHPGYLLSMGGSELTIELIWLSTSSEGSDQLLAFH